MFFEELNETHQLGGAARLMRSSIEVTLASHKISFNRTDILIFFSRNVKYAFIDGCNGIFFCKCALISITSKNCRFAFADKSNSEKWRSWFFICSRAAALFNAYRSNMRWMRSSLHVLKAGRCKENDTDPQLNRASLANSL